LTETTKNFLAVLGLNVANHINAPLNPDSPFTDGATATAKSAWKCYDGKSGLNVSSG
jgi:hypothetical protein